ncbi:MAG: DUF1385 domain-containing protein [Clostridia bacterium]
MAESFYYGGQAVIEGVMMRGQTSLAIAVRKPSGEIVTKEEKISSVTERFPILKRPLIRGSVALVEALVLGIRALNYSASQFAGEEEEQLGPKEIALTLALSLLLTVGLFIVLPAFVIRQIQGYIASNVLLNTVEGLIKIAFFLAYVAAISLMKDIRRVFQYHGAEHKAINCYEAGDPLTVEAVRSHSLIHKRCGTSFIIFVLLVSIFVFSFFGRPPFLQRVLLHLALLPVVAGISYELIRLAGRKDSPWIIDVLSRPGMWTQRLTTREPDDEQIEVAIQSLRAVLLADGKAAPESRLIVP